MASYDKRLRQLRISLVLMGVILVIYVAYSLMNVFYSLDSDSSSAFSKYTALSIPQKLHLPIKPAPKISPRPKLTSRTVSPPQFLAAIDGSGDLRISDLKQVHSTAYIYHPESQDELTMSNTAFTLIHNQQSSENPARHLSEPAVFLPGKITSRDLKEEKTRILKNNFDIQLFKYSSIASFLRNSTNKAASSLKCQDNSCELDNLCFTMQRMGGYETFYTLGESRIDWNGQEFSLPWLQDIDRRPRSVPVERFGHFQIFRLSGATYLFPRSFNSDNWSFSKKLLPLYEYTQKHKYSEDRAYISHHLLYLISDSLTPWQREMMNIVRFSLQQSPSYSDANSVQFLKKNSEFVAKKGWSDVLLYRSNTDMKDFPPKTLLCMDTAMFPFLHDGIASLPFYVSKDTLLSLRNDAYSYFNIELPKQLPNTITVLTKKDLFYDPEKFVYQLSHLVNSELSMNNEPRDESSPAVPTVASTSVKLYDISEWSLEKQISLMSSTGLLICLHSDILMNELFLPVGAVVLEIFPFNTKHRSSKGMNFATMSQQLGLDYYSWSPSSSSDAVFTATDQKSNWEQTINQCFDHTDENDEDGDCLKWWLTEPKTRVRLSSDASSARTEVTNAYNQLKANIRTRNRRKLVNDVL